MQEQTPLNRTYQTGQWKSKAHPSAVPHGSPLSEESNDEPKKKTDAIEHLTSLMGDRTMHVADAIRESDLQQRAADVAQSFGEALNDMDGTATKNTLIDFVKKRPLASAAMVMRFAKKRPFVSAAALGVVGYIAFKRLR